MPPAKRGPYEPDPDNTGGGIGALNKHLPPPKENEMCKATKLVLTIITTFALCAFGNDEISEIEEIIVTAVFRIDELGSIPTSIAVVT